MSGTVDGNHEMNRTGICAIIVSFHPSHELLPNISLLLPQVSHVVIVDNGSTQEELLPLRAATRDPSLTLIENRCNLGIGAALNIGVRWARDSGFTWVVLFDQDSSSTADLVSQLWATAHSHLETRKVALTCPLYVDPTTMVALRRGVPAKDAGVMTAMTSGSLIPLWVFEQCGFFNEDLFVDQVDFEYCLRLRKQRLIVLQSDQAALLHSPGSPKPFYLCGIRLFSVSHHSAKRRYFMARNCIWMIRKFWKEFPAWCFGTGSFWVKDTVKMMVAEEDRWDKLKNTVLGVVHGMQGKLGNTMEM